VVDLPESETPIPEKKPVPTREPRALSNEYHKARKQLMLWSGILFIWELVGVDLNKAGTSGGNIGTLISSIKSPQAVPWVLLVLVAYFAFKLRIEWRQCSEARRQVPEAIQDYYIAFIVAGIAWVLYFGQAIIHIQFADYFSSLTGYLTSGAAYVVSWSSILAGVLAGVGVGVGIGGLHAYLASSRYLKSFHWGLLFPAPLVLLSCYLISLVTDWEINWTALLTTMAIVCAVYLIAAYLARKAFII
jgi:hypothetical protein